MPMTPETVYEERVSSGRTEALFVGLMLLFVLLLVVRVGGSGFGWLAALFLFLAAFFLFYALNYRTLVIRTTPETLVLTFGVFSWTVPWDAVARCHRDATPTWTLGGAGIHFRMIRGRYSVFFNFLEHPRIVLELNKPRGLVRDVVFSTRRPAKLLDIATAMAGSRDGVEAGR